MGRLRRKDRAVPFRNGAWPYACGGIVSADRAGTTAGQGRELESRGLCAFDRTSGESFFRPQKLSDRGDERRLQGLLFLRDAGRPGHCGLFPVGKDQKERETGGACAAGHSLAGVLLEAAVLYFLPVYDKHELLVQIRVPGEFYIIISGSLLGRIPSRKRRVSQREALAGHPRGGRGVPDPGARLAKSVAGGRKREQLDRDPYDRRNDLVSGIYLCAGRRPGDPGKAGDGKEEPADPGRGPCALRAAGSLP